MKMYDLIPTNREKASDGTLKRLYFAEPSVTTCAHIRSFWGLDKKGFIKLEA